MGNGAESTPVCRLPPCHGATNLSHLRTNASCKVLVVEPNQLDSHDVDAFHQPSTGRCRMATSAGEAVVPMSSRGLKRKSVLGRQQSKALATADPVLSVELPAEQRRISERNRHSVGTSSLDSSPSWAPFVSAFFTLYKNDLLRFRLVFGKDCQRSTGDCHISKILNIHCVLPAICQRRQEKICQLIVRLSFQEIHLQSLNQVILSLPRNR